MQVLILGQDPVRVGEVDRTISTYTGEENLTEGLPVSGRCMEDVNAIIVVYHDRRGEEQAKVFVMEERPELANILKQIMVVA